MTEPHKHTLTSSASIEPNAVFCADCLTLFERIADESMGLVYLDPPFFSDDALSAGRSEYSSLSDYLDFIELVVRHSRRVLAPSGSLFFHSEPRTTGSIRPVLDEVFGRHSFVNEIVWPRNVNRVSMAGGLSRPRSEHDSIFYYGKTESFIYHAQYRLRPAVKKLQVAGEDSHGRFVLESLFYAGVRLPRQFSWKGVVPPKDQSWRYSEDQLEQFMAEGRIVFQSNPKAPRLKRYRDELQEVGSVWDDINSFPGVPGESRYPTQKPVELMERIVCMSTDPATIILDPFCGSGTTLIAAHQSNRRWIGCDSSNEAYSITVSRLTSTFGLLVDKDFQAGDESLLRERYVVQPNQFSKRTPTEPLTTNTVNNDHAPESGELSEGFRYAIENKFPYPISSPFELLRGLNDWRAEIPQLANILAAAIEYLAVIAVAEYGALEQKNPELSARLAEDLKKPLSLGGWAGLLRRIMAFTSETKKSIAVSELADSFFLERGQPGPSLEERINELIKLRNDLIKRTGDRIISRHEHDGFKRRLIDLLRALSFLKEYPLVTPINSSTEGGVKWHDCYLQMGSRGMFEKIRVDCDLDLESRVTLLNLNTHEALQLYPFYLTRECPHCSLSHFFRFDRLDGKSGHYVGPDGHNLRDDRARSDILDLVAGPAHSGLKKQAHYLASDPFLVSSVRSVPTHIGKYRIISLIRRGGMADVFKVEVAGDDHVFALKLLPYQFFRDPTVVRRFRQEAQQARSLQHLNIVRVFDYGEEAAEHYLVMELAPGWRVETGTKALDVGDLQRPLSERSTLSIIKQTCEGLDYIHHQKIIHRDIKPANLLLFQDSGVKLSDFGIARSQEAMTLTMTGLNVGTPEYCSPEQADGQRDLTFASDIYSVGVVMFELLTGISPFKRTTPMSTLMAHLRDPVPNPQSQNQSVSPPLSRIVTKCLQKDPAQRYQSARELLNALYEYEKTPSVEPTHIGMEAAIQSTLIADHPTTRTRGKFTEENFYQAVAKFDLLASEGLRAFFDKARKRDLTLEPGDNSIILKYKGYGIELNLGIFRANGWFENRRIAALTERAGHAEIGESYLARLAALFDRGYVHKSNNRWTWTVKKGHNEHVNIADCLPVQDRFLDLAQDTINQYLAALNIRANVEGKPLRQQVASIPAHTDAASYFILNNKAERDHKRIYGSDRQLAGFAIYDFDERQARHSYNSAFEEMKPGDLALVFGRDRRVKQIYRVTGVTKKYAADIKIDAFVVYAEHFDTLPNRVLYTEFINQNNLSNPNLDPNNNFRRGMLVAKCLRSK